jgi:hypothetical protein
MAIEISAEVRGIKEDLKLLNKLAPDLRRQITKDYKALMQPTISDAQNNLPSGIGLTVMRGFGRKWRHIMPWDKAIASRGVTVKIDTRRARKKNLVNGAQFETLGAFIIQQKNPAGIVFDIAGRGGRSTSFQNRKGTRYDWNNTLIENLAETFPETPSRTMYPAVEKNQENINEAIAKITQDVSDKLTQAIARTGQI